MVERKYLHLSDIHNNQEALKIVAEHAKKRNDLEAILITGDLLGPCINEQEVRQMQEGAYVIHNSIKTEEPVSLETLVEYCQSNPEVPTELKEIADRYAEAVNKFDQNSKKQYSEMKEIIDEIPQEKIMVPGNWDSDQFDKYFGEYNIHLKKKELNGETFAGYGNANSIPVYLPPTRMYNHYNEKELYKFLKEADPTIAVLHNPPNTLEDGEVEMGSLGALAYINDNKPDLVVCGHAHGRGGNKTKDRTTVVRAGSLGDYTKEQPDTAYFSEIIKEGNKIKQVIHYQIKNGQISEI